MNLESNQYDIPTQVWVETNAKCRKSALRAHRYFCPKYDYRGVCKETTTGILCDKINCARKEEFLEKYDNEINQMNNEKE